MNEFPSPCASKFTIYTKTGCKYCDLVKDLLINEDVNIINCDTYLSPKELKELFLKYIYSITNIEYRTFPMVFYDGKFIGGFTETKEWINKKNAFIDI